MECVKENGVTRDCPFDKLDYFDVTTLLPLDVMHDFLEGVVPLVLRLVLSKAHREKAITIQEFNEELRKLTFGQNDKKTSLFLFLKNFYTT